MNATVYAFEAKEIQAYILDRTRMREMVGASGLIDALCDTPLITALDALNLKEPQDYVVCRRGGGGFTLLFSQRPHAKALRDMISLLIPQWAPELPFVHTLCEAATPPDAINQAMAQLKILVHQPATSLPVAGPITERSRYTGLPASTRRKELLDRAATAKQRFARQRDRLGDKFLSTRVGNKLFSWPIDLNPSDFNAEEAEAAVPRFPHRKDNHYLGIVHIDGNGFGQALISLRDQIRNRTDYAAIEYAFSRTIEEISIHAACHASSAVLLPVAQAEEQTVLPARPLILGGDDITLIVRADLALDYATVFIQAFEEESSHQLNQLNTDYALALPNRFTACAGLAYVGAKQPFYRAYQLTEELCARAKQSAKAVSNQNGGTVPSAIAFTRMSNLLTEQRNAGEPRLEGAVYALDLTSKGLPRLARLLELQQKFEQDDNLQGLVKPLYSQMSQKIGAEALYKRWRTVHPQGCEILDDLLAQLGNKVDAHLPLVHCGTQCFTPLGDLKTLIDIHNLTKNPQGADHADSEN